MLFSIVALIGGLDDVKEMLRQCITYPLKYPRLYQVSGAHWIHRGVMSTYAICVLITLSVPYPAVCICVGVTLRCSITERLAFTCCLF
jgi:membrane glycosyltransferase